MCGIFGCFKNCVSTLPLIDNYIMNIMVDKAKLRGDDGFGFTVNGLLTSRITDRHTRYEDLVKDGRSDFDRYNSNTGHIDWVLLNCRAKPETEPPTSLTNLQPIMTRRMVDNGMGIGSYIVHNGSLSNDFVEQVYRECDYKPDTKIDSEAFTAILLNAYYQYTDNYKNLNLVDFLKQYFKRYFSIADGGFAMIGNLIWSDMTNIFVVACKYQPLYELEINIIGVGKYYYLHSVKEALEDVQDYITENLIRDNEIVFTLREFPPYTFKLYIDSPYLKGFTEESKFTPTYSYPIIDNPCLRKKILVSTSGGIDSTCSLMMAYNLTKNYDEQYDIEAVHFKYGHRGQEAEEQAIRKIIDEANKKEDINITLKVVNLESIYKDFFNVKNSQLIDKEANVETGSNDKIKTTIAWVPVRNMLFQTLMYGLAETYILEQGYKDVYIVAGWNQLSEEGFYPDNSTRFTNAMSLASKFGTLVGHRIHNWNICSRLLKSDEWALAKLYDFLDLYQYTISCDCPVKDKDTYYNCNGQCGSTILSQIASKRYIGIKDPRVFKKNPNIVVDKPFEYYEEEPVELDTTIIKEIKNRILDINSCD